MTTAQTMYDVSVDWYADRMEEDWEPATTEQASDLFGRHGLVGDFWSLA